MQRVALGVRAKEYLTLHDVYLLLKIGSRLRRHLRNGAFINAYRELKNAACVLTGRKKCNIYHVLQLKKLYEAFGFKAAESKALKDTDDGVKSLENLICYFSGALKVAPMDFAKNTPINMLPVLQNTVKKLYIEKWKNALYAQHAPQDFDRYLNDVLSSLEQDEASTEYVDRIAKALQRSPNLNRKPEPHWANAEAFLRSRMLQ